MSFTLLIVFFLCSCMALGLFNRFWMPVVAYMIWYAVHGKVAVQHLYMYRVCFGFSIAYALRTFYYFSSIYAICFALYAVAGYYSYRRVKAIESYQAPDDEPLQEDDPNAQS